MLRNDSNGNLELYGIEKDIFDEFSKMLNFKIKVEFHGIFSGFIFENGSATGKLKSQGSNVNKLIEIKLIQLN